MTIESEWGTQKQGHLEMTFIFSLFPSLWVSVLCVRDSGDDGTSGLGICGFFTLSCDTSSVPNKMDLCTSHKVTLMSRWNSTFEGILTSVSTMKAFVLWFFFYFFKMNNDNFPFSSVQRLVHEGAYKCQLSLIIFSHILIQKNLISRSKGSFLMFFIMKKLQTSSWDVLKIIVI